MNMVMPAGWWGLREALCNAAIAHYRARRLMETTGEIGSYNLTKAELEAAVEEFGKVTSKVDDEW